MTDTTTLSRAGWLDSDNEQTKPPVVDLYVSDRAIVADCRRCGASSYWILEDASQAASAIRSHYGDRCS